MPPLFFAQEMGLWPLRIKKRHSPLTTIAGVFSYINVSFSRTTKVFSRTTEVFSYSCCGGFSAFLGRKGGFCICVPL